MTKIELEKKIHRLTKELDTVTEEQDQLRDDVDFWIDEANSFDMIAQSLRKEAEAKYGMYTELCKSLLTFDCFSHYNMDDMMKMSPWLIAEMVRGGVR
jgi:hypothetical protein